MDINSTDDKNPKSSDKIPSPREKVQSFMRRMNFNYYVNRGESNEEAARKVGADVGPGERLKMSEIMDLKFHGKLPKQRKKL